MATDINTTIAGLAGFIGVDPTTWGGGTNPNLPAHVTLAQLGLPATAGQFTRDSKDITLLTSMMSKYPTAGGPVTRADVKVAMAALLDARAAGQIKDTDDLMDPAVLAKIAGFTPNYAKEVPGGSPQGTTVDQYRFTANPSALGAIYQSAGAAKGVGGSGTTSGAGGVAGSGSTPAMPGYPGTSSYTGSDVSLTDLGLPHKHLDKGNDSTPIINSMVAKINSSINAAGFSPLGGSDSKANRQQTRAILIAIQDARDHGELKPGSLTSAENLAAIAARTGPHLDGYDRNMFVNNVSLMAPVISALGGKLSPNSNQLTQFPNTTDMTTVTGNVIADLGWQLSPANVAYLNAVYASIMQAANDKAFVGPDPASAANVEQVRKRMDPTLNAQASVQKTTLAMQGLFYELANAASAASFQQQSGQIGV